MNAKILSAAIASISLVCILSACSLGATDEGKAVGPDAADSGVTDSAAVAPTFYGAWAGTDSMPALPQAPARIESGDPVELIFMFVNGSPSETLTAAYVVAADEPDVRFELRCMIDDEGAGDMIGCFAPPFTDPSDSTEYRGVIETSSGAVEGSAYISRSAVSGV